jgi:rhodanese-related sulfurtransferase
MYDSLHHKLLVLPDETRVYPAHGAGSLCGRSIGKETWSTIGRERMMNPALRPMSREQFIAEITRDVPETPVYFLHSRDANQAGPALREGRSLPPSLAPAAVAAAIERGAVLLDTRTAAAYGAGHPLGALHVSLDGQYASWVGTLVRPEQEIVILADPARAEEAVTRLARVGYENVIGFLEGGIERWRDEGRPIAVTVQEAAETALRSGRAVLDVRRRPEWEAFHLEHAVHIPLAQLAARAGELDPSRSWTVVCASGYRSIIAASVLERAGLRDVTNAVGGLDAWRKAGLALNTSITPG